MSHDITRILNEWDYDPNHLIRVIKADDGREILQVRQPLGIEQYELSGRPDGMRPEGKVSYLEHFTQKLREYKEQNQTDSGFQIDHEDFLKLQSEGILYYYRYLILFQVSDFERTAADTDHNLGLCDLVETYAVREKDKKEILQYRPYILRINAISKAMISLKQQLKAAATETIEAAIDVIKKMPSIDTPAFHFEKIRSINSLRATLKQIQEQEISPLDKLKAELDQAVEEEDYEKAAQLRDRIRDLETVDHLHDDSV